MANASGKADAIVMASSSSWPIRTCCWCCRKKVSWRWSGRHPISSPSSPDSRASKAKPGTTRCWQATSCSFATASRWPRSGCPSPAAEGCSCRCEPSIDLPKILIKPGHHLSNQVGSLLRDVVRCFERHRLLVGCRRAEHLKQRIFAQKDPVELAGDHQRRRLQVRRKIGLVRSRQRLYVKESSIEEDRGLEPVFHRRQVQAQRGAHALAHEGNPVSVELGAGLQIVEGASQIFRVLDKCLAAGGCVQTRQHGGRPVV